MYRKHERTYLNIIALQHSGWDQEWALSYSSLDSLILLVKYNFPLTENLFFFPMIPDYFVCSSSVALFLCCTRSITH